MERDGLRVSGGMTRVYSCPWADLKSRPTRSISTLSKGTPVMGRGMSGTGTGLAGAVCWHRGHHWQKFLTYASIPGQWMQSLSLVRVF